MRQILANSIAPTLDIDTHEVPSEQEPGKGYLLAVVPQSARAPHAAVKDGDLRFFTEDGRASSENLWE